MGNFIYRGYVANRKDPEKQGRLMLRIPQLWAEQVHEYWAYPKGMFIGKGIGMVAMPEVGDMVWVQFENGDQRFPVWEYGHWPKSSDAIADIYDADGEPTKVMLKTKSGHVLVFDDKAGEIDLKHSGGQHIHLNKEHISIVSDKDKGISLGSLDQSAEPAVLGDKNATALNNTLDGIAQLTVMTAMGASSVPLNVATFQQIKATDVPATKSDKVTLD